ncbi:MAG: site-2 protease family protein, partial [Oscillospiraceae bacterium]
MSFIIKALASILVFGLIIFIHEFGHFIVAKLSKIKVNEFALGMGPKLFSKQKGDTLYSLRAFPIGGFCAMEGEDEDSDDKGAFSKAPVLNRIGVVVAGAIMNLILGFVVLLCLTAGEKTLASRTISVFDDNAVTQSSGLEVGDTIIAIDGRKMYIADDIIYELV